ncbi:MAG: hypothetical protein AAGB27_16965, partial [Pseudomonadota bacterium]
PPSPESEDGRTPGQQRTWVVAVLALLTMAGPVSTLWADGPLTAPPMAGDRPAESAYDVIADRGYQRRIEKALREEHGRLFSWHLFFASLLLGQKERSFDSSPTVTVAFPDNSRIVYDITGVSSNWLRLEVGKATDGAGNLIYPPDDVGQYSGNSGRLITTEQFERFLAYLERLDVPVSLETDMHSPARWRCRGPEATLSCRVFSERPRQLPAGAASQGNPG